MYITDESVLNISLSHGFRGSRKLELVPRGALNLTISGFMWRVQFGLVKFRLRRILITIVLP